MKRVVAFSVSNSPDLDRLGLFDRSLPLTVSALATGLVRHGWRVAYGGNLDRSGFTYTLYPAVAEAYRALPTQIGRPPFLHFVARYQWREIPEILEHIEAVKNFAEICLVDAERHVRNIRMRNKEYVWEAPGREPEAKVKDKLLALLQELPQGSGEEAEDLSAMRSAMEASVDARILIGGQIAGYKGCMPGVIEEALRSLEQGHILIALGGFGGAARDVAAALGLIGPNERIVHDRIGRGYEEALARISDHVEGFHRFAEVCWGDFVAAARAEDPEHASRHVMRILACHESVARR